VTTRRLVEESAVLVDGPWTHREISANGIRFHVAEAGAGPLVLLLHGFPQFWWAWRHQLVALSEAGFRAVAPDLRGYGASDKPPRGYDAYTLSADVTGLIRALGETQAVLVGHGWGGVLAMAVARLHPDAVRRLALVGTAHPLALRAAALRSPAAQGRRSAYSLRFQLPWAPERWLVSDDAVHVAELLQRWGGPGYPDPAASKRYRAAMQILYVPHRALEYHRWVIRSQLRPDGRRFARLMAAPFSQPILQIHGELDGSILPATARGTARYAAAGYAWVPIPGVGHFVPEEAPGLVSGELVAWAKAN
jgi:pimeloyl-ACP methyl ester carboxylesterase